MKLRTTSSLAKFTVKIRSPKEAVAGEAGSSLANTGASWLTKGSENIAAEVANARVMAQKRYAPEFYIKDGDTRKVRFRSSEPLGLFRQYNVRMGGKWQRITAPPAGERDLMREAGLKPSMRVLYEIIDIEGYEDKQGKSHTNVPRFFVTNMRIHEQLEVIRKKKGTLTTFDIEISRVGSGPKTTYTLLPEDPAPLRGIEKIPSLKNDVEKYYAPPTLKEQQVFMAGYSPEEQDNG